MNVLTPTLNKNLRFNNSKLFLHLKLHLTIMLVNFYLNKSFFPHDITLIASVVGESAVSRLTMVLTGSCAPFMCPKPFLRVCRSHFN